MSGEVSKQIPERWTEHYKFLGESEDNCLDVDEGRKLIEEIGAAEARLASVTEEKNRVSSEHYDALCEIASIKSERDHFEEQWAEALEELAAVTKENEGLRLELGSPREAVRVAQGISQRSDAENTRLRDALKGVEWIQVEYGERKFCPECKRWQDDGHERYCALGAALKEKP